MLLLALSPLVARAQTQSPDPDAAAPFGPPIDDRQTFAHGLLDQLEGRFGSGARFRWEGEGWWGGDTNRLWIKSEGEVAEGRVQDGQQEVYYSRAISTYFDLQAGGRYDLDSLRGRGWGALGVEGFAPYYFTVSATAYASDTGHYAARLEASNEIRLTQKLILEPRAEMNLYTRSDPERRLGSGLSDLDAGLRLRYEVSRKFAPYVGLTYEHAFSQTANLIPSAGQKAEDFGLTVGARTWF